MDNVYTDVLHDPTCHTAHGGSSNPPLKSPLYFPPIGCQDKYLSTSRLDEAGHVTADGDDGVDDDPREVAASATWRLSKGESLTLAWSLRQNHYYGYITAG